MHTTHEPQFGHVCYTVQIPTVPQNKPHAMARNVTPTGVWLSVHTQIKGAVMLFGGIIRNG
jgi:hypothetical protein